MSVRPVPGGITAAHGFLASGVAAGIKASGALDVTLIVSEREASVAAVFTTNQVQAAPVVLSRDHVRESGGRARAVIINSGCANACTGSQGMAAARATVEAVAALVGCPENQVIVCSTGVIGVDLPSDKVIAGATAAHASLGRNGAAAARGIMTTDVAPKESSVEVTTPAGTFRVGGIAKGAGMIEPNMATMLAFVTTDAAVSPALLDRAVREVADRTFNAITIDGDSSTNDTFALLASGASGVEVDEALYPSFVEGVETVARALALMIVRGGEGATKLVAVRVTGAASTADAKRAAKTIANSLLVKTAIHGADPNWGRLVAAAGRSGATFVLERALVEVGPLVLFRDGQPHDDQAPAAAEYLRQSVLDVHVDLGTGGQGGAVVWTCDLSAEYVRINGEYRT
jgi:glutamate N-acetyltransferase/amino-acid N-acetyltransferase